MSKWSKNESLLWRPLPLFLIRVSKGEFLYGTQYELRELV